MLHKYVITDAINDDNVLKFSVEYVGRYREKNGNSLDIEVEDINIKELLESSERVEKIVDYILANHNRKTHRKEFNSIFAVLSVEMAIKYYEIFKSKNHNLKIATIFSYSANEENKETNGVYNLDESDGAYIDETHINQHSREKLDEFIEDYNRLFGTKFSTRDNQSFYNYYNDISKRTKQKEIDILLVVNMFLTGFDSPQLNTLYIDKNLKYHGLIQAFSRTNRILNEKKSQGNIVSFRNLKKETDEAIALFSNREAKDIILMKPYENYVDKFNEDTEKLLEIVPDVSSVDELMGEEEKFQFIQAFRALMRNKNILDGFSAFKREDLSLNEQTFEDYKSKYLDLYESSRTAGEKEKVSILDDVDFELELIQKDEINVSYILKLLAKFKDYQEEEKEKQKESVINIINSNPKLRSKRELIENFINNMLDNIDIEEIEEEFDKFVDIERDRAFNNLIEKENLHNEELQSVIDSYLYNGRKPLNDDIAKTLRVKPNQIIKRIDIKVFLK
jgi:type I restriction enzyme R subunit